MASWAETNLSDAVIRAFEEQGFEQPSALQRKIFAELSTLPAEFAFERYAAGGGRAALLAGVLNALSKGTRQALLVVPDDESVLRLSQELHRFGRYVLGLHILPLYMERAPKLQLKQLQQQPRLVICSLDQVDYWWEQGRLPMPEMDLLAVADIGVIEDEELADSFLQVWNAFAERKRWFLKQANSPAPLDLAVFCMEHHFSRDPKQRELWALPTLEKVRDRCVLDLLDKGRYPSWLVFENNALAAQQFADVLTAWGWPAAAIVATTTANLLEKYAQAWQKGDLPILVITDTALQRLEWSLSADNAIHASLPMDSETYSARLDVTAADSRHWHCLQDQAQRVAYERLSGSRLLEQQAKKRPAMVESVQPVVSTTEDPSAAYDSRITWATFRVEIGSKHGLEVHNLQQFFMQHFPDGMVGPIRRHKKYTLVELPRDLPASRWKCLRKQRLCGQRLEMSRVEDVADRGRKC